MNRHVEVAAIVAARAAAAPAGGTWVADLPGILAALERSWSVTIGDPVPGGTASYVAHARTRDGHPAVVKVAVPGTGFARQVRTLTAAAGRGHVLLLAHDTHREAALLELLGSPLPEVGLPPEAQLSVLARCLQHAWRVPRAAGQQPEDKAAGLGEVVADLWNRLGSPGPAEVLDRALAFSRRRSEAFTSLVRTGSCVVVHGDAAPANVARVLDPRPGTEDGFVLVDPDGFLGDPAYDLGVAVRDWCPLLLTTENPVEVLAGYCRLLGGQAGVDPVAVWEWGFLERVSTGLHVLALGARDEAEPYLRSARALLADAPRR